LFKEKAPLALFLVRGDGISKGFLDVRFACLRKPEIPKAQAIRLQIVIVLIRLCKSRRTAKQMKLNHQYET
jgi:hypothetical protein